MKITVTSKTENPVRTCAAAAWGCTHDKSREPENFTLAEADALVERVMLLGHLGIAENASFTVLVEGISRCCSHQLVRSRLTSYSQKSQRYVKANNPDVVIPEPVSRITRAQDHFDNAIKTAYLEYNALLAMGIPAEDARYVLPNATCTSITITMNARSWIGFFQQRCCLKAQTEIRVMAHEIYRQLYMIAPALFNSSKIPNCGSKGECKGCRGLCNE